MKRYALIIGIGEYQHLPNLSKPVGDATAVYELLKAEGEFQDIKLLTGKKVTTKALQKELKTLLLQRGENSDLVLYFTGHGFTVGDEFDQRGLLATYDCRKEQQNGLSFTWLNNLIQQASLSSLALFLDCCESEFFIENALLQTSLSDLTKKSCFCSAACRTFEQAYARTSAQHSFFTGAMLKALRQRDQGEITAFQVHQHIAPQLKAQHQEPVYIGRGDNITLLDYRRRESVAATVSEECPYQGLRAFDKTTAQFFFGREAAVDDLISRLTRSSFVPVIGASGSGKSSVVRAGLVLWAERQGWRVLGPIKPGPRPLDRLQGAFDGVFDNREIGEIYELIETEGLTAVLPRLPSGRYLLVIDQFEEVFTVCASKERQRQFVGCITGISQQSDSPLKIVTTMRSDFVTPWLSSDALTKVIQNDAVWLGTLQNDPLKTAIEQPALVQGYTVERELLALIESDVKAEENCLPLLEFALTQLWDERDQQAHTLTAAAYREMGQLRGALNQRAEQIYNENGGNAKGFKTDLDRDWCRRICLELVRIGPEGTDTRRRQRRQDVLDKGKSEKEQETINNVIETLVEGRLLVADKADGDANQTIDIAHEALMNGWERFADWREADRDQLRLLQRMKDSYEEWLGKAKDNNYLLQKGLLAEVRERWAELKADVTGGLYNYFSRSDEQEKAEVTQLQQALAKAELREVRTKMISLPPAKAVDKTLLAVKAVGDSLEKLQGEVIAPAQDALNRVWRKICERLKIEGHTSSV
ncbi:MAG: caspase family protein, partial [Cyanobacteria bacterium J06632_22]